MAQQPVPQSRPFVHVVFTRTQAGSNGIDILLKVSGPRARPLRSRARSLLCAGRCPRILARVAADASSSSSDRVAGGRNSVGAAAGPCARGGAPCRAAAGASGRRAPGTGRPAAHSARHPIRYSSSRSAVDGVDHPAVLEV